MLQEFAESHESSDTLNRIHQTDPLCLAPASRSAKTPISIFWITASSSPACQDLWRSRFVALQGVDL